VIITLNGRAAAVADGTTVADLIVTQAGTHRGSAAVVDGEVVPRSVWSVTTLREGQQVEIVTAVQGG
jgi:sulfur carrier protein